MQDLYKELERTCERTTKELSDFNNRLDANKNMISPADLDCLFKLMDIIKDVKSTMKKMMEIEEMEMGSANQNGYSGNYYTQPMWDRNYSGNSYRGTYTVESGNGYSGTGRMGRRYSRNSETENMRQELDNMLNEARDEREADVIRKLMNRL